MMLIGITFFTFSGQEHSSAEYYADSAKVYSVAAADSIFDFALEQLIIGPRDNNTQSVLWPGRMSLVPNMLGMFAPNPTPNNGVNLVTIPTDRHPWNGGAGINIIAGPKGQAFLDQDFNGVNDNPNPLKPVNSYLLTLNWSPAATVNTTTNPAVYPVPYYFTTRSQFFTPNTFPAIDVGYTYPDMNNPFLAHIGTISVGAASNPTVYSVVIPSFHRGQYLRDPASGAPYIDFTNNLDWQVNPATATLVLRPHPNHMSVVNPATTRFLQTASQIPGSNPPHIVQPFGGLAGLPGFRTGPSPNNIYGDMGLWTNSVGAGAVLGYDVDNDGDGILEGIWMDLNFPISILLDGRISCPMVSFTVIEADSLINPNVHGNMSRITSVAHPLTGPQLSAMGVGVNTPISRSNQGGSPSEVNPWWVLVADPTNAAYLNPPNTFGNPQVALQPYRGFYNQGANPGAYVPDRLEMANMDMLFMLWGRPNYSVTVGGGGSETYTLTDLTAGLWGELNALLAGTQSGNPSLFPRPGQPNVDDNNNQNAGVNETDPNIGLSFPPFSHPLDYYGAGSPFQYVSASGLVIPSLVAPNPPGVPPSPARFLQYYGYQSQANFNPQSAYTTMGVLQGVMGGSYLTQNPYSFAGLSGVMDEPYEVVVDPKYQQLYDQIFGTDEMPGLHLSQSDYLAGLGQSRLRQLAPFNFELNQQAALIRKRFTTASSDRKQHEWAYSPTRSWEYGIRSSNGAAPIPNVNNWDGSGPNQFPPMVIGNSMAGLIPTAANSNSNDTTNANGYGSKPEPFRMEVAAAIGAMANNAPQYDALGNLLSNGNAFNTPAYNFPTFQQGMDPWHQQMRLNINRLLTVVDPSQPFTPSNPLRYRELTPHPTLLQWKAGTGSTAIPKTPPIMQTSPSPPPYAFKPTAMAYPSQTSGTSFANNPVLQEYWARRDRQMLARDIYVMLYMFGGGADTDKATGFPMNYANTVTANNQAVAGVRPVYADWQLQEMAQFAVNYVDALDRDDTITVFEYDADLSNGWNLDDNPMTPDVGGGDRGVVYGVEAQQLAFSEALVIVAPQVKDKISGTPKDHPATLWDDSKPDRTFAYLELSNVSPYAVPVNNLNWQVLLMQPGAGTPALNPATGAALTVLTLNDFQTQSVAAGQPYTIGSRTYVQGTDDVNGKPFPSTFVVDPNWNNGVANPDPAFQTPAQSQMAPAYNPLVLPALNLDLVTQAYQAGTPTISNQPFMLTTGTTLNAADTTVGDFVNFGPDVKNGPFGLALPAYQTTFVLRRRLNLNRPATQIGTGSFNQNDDDDNPWVEVDRIVYQNSDVPLEGMGMGTALSTPPGGFFRLRDQNDPSITGGNVAQNDIQPKLMRQTAKERKQPLDGFDGTNSPMAPSVNPQFSTVLNTYVSHVNFYPNASVNTVRPNTIGTTNYITTQAPLNGAFTLWQPHFDRDFASVMELLSLPLYGPSVLTTCMAPKETQAQIPNVAALNNLAVETPLPAVAAGNGGANAGMYQPLIAQAKFFRPENPQNIGRPSGSTTPLLDNRWHRILELLEVPTVENLQVDNFLLQNYQWLSPQPLQRAPGKMNLNGLRYGENLSALLDDPSAFNPFAYYNDGSYGDRVEGVNRNWWQQLLAARDADDFQIRTKLGVGSAPVVGAPGSRPFRSFSFTERNPDTYNNSAAGGTAWPTSVDDTLLRTLPLDPPNGANGAKLEQRGLFEARAQSDTIGQAGADAVDYYTRQRLLAKIAGNTTNRSNVFIVWITIGFFEGFQDPVGNPGVTQIGAEMADQTRRRGFFIVDRSLLEDAWNPTTGTYDFRKFIQYRKTLQ